MLALRVSFPTVQLPAPNVVPTAKTAIPALAAVCVSPDISQKMAAVWFVAWINTPTGR